MRGLVLEGGGAKGSYHVGVYKAILEEGIDIQGITGTSIGALNGAMIVQGDFDLCYELWQNISYSMLINANNEEVKSLMNMKLNREDLIILGEKLKKVIKTRGLDITPFKEHIDHYIDEDKVRKSKKDFGMVTVNITDLKPMEVFIEDIPQGQLKNYLLASSYLPVFKMERLDGKIYLDGGFYDNLPFNLLEKKGYKDLILVRTHAAGLIKKIDTKGINITVISPSDDIGKSYKLESELAQKNIELGYYDALRVLRGLDGKKYSIIPNEDKLFFENFLLGMEDDKVNRIRELLSVSYVPKTRALFEFIIPKIANMMELDDDYSYKDLIIALLETKLNKLGVNKFKIYSFEELLKLLQSKGPSKHLKKEKSSSWEKIIEKIDLANILNKEELILEIADLIFIDDVRF